MIKESKEEVKEFNGINQFVCKGIGVCALKKNFHSARGTSLKGVKKSGSLLGKKINFKDINS